MTIGLYLGSAVFSYIQGWIMSGISMDITYRFRKDIAEKINRMPFKYFDNTSQGEVLSRITNDVDTVSQTLNQSLSQIITSVVSCCGCLDHDDHHQLANDPGCPDRSFLSRWLIGDSDRPSVSKIF